MPLLSNVIIGRNDNYNPFFVNRVNYVIEYTAWLMSECNIDSNVIEIIIVDWGSEKMLKDSLHLSENASKIVKFIEIDKNIANKESSENRGYINVAKAYNTAIRLSNAEFINFTSHDLIFDRISFINLLNYLKIIQKEQKDILINIQRKFVPINLFLTTPSFEYLNRWLETSGRLVGDYGVMHGGGQAGYITSKNIWNKLTGIYEKFDGYGFLEYDFFSRATNICNWIDSTNFGASMHKIHRGEAEKREYARKHYLNKQWTTFRLDPNKNWGLSNYKLKIIQNSKYRKLDLNKIKLIKYENQFYKNKILDIFKILFGAYNIPVKIKIDSIKYFEVKIILTLINLLNFNKNSRSIVFIGYKKGIMPRVLSCINDTLEIFVLDDIFFASNKNSKNNQINNHEIRNLGLLDKRAIRLAQSLMDKKKPHKGYFRSFSGDVGTTINSLDKTIPRESLCNILFIDSAMFDNKNHDLINNFISDNNKNIYCFFINNEFPLSTLISQKYFKLEIQDGYSLYINRTLEPYRYKTNFFKLLTSYLSINIGIFILKLLKIKNFLIRKFFK